MSQNKASRYAESGVDIDVCDECHGVWLDPGELDALANTTQLMPRQFAADDLSDLKCPRCFTLAFAQIEHGIWIVGEMRRLWRCVRWR